MLAYCDSDKKVPYPLAFPQTTAPPWPAKHGNMSSSCNKVHEGCSTSHSIQIALVDYALRVYLRHKLPGSQLAHTCKIQDTGVDLVFIAATEIPRGTASQHGGVRY